MTTHTDKKEESVSEKLVHRDVEALEQNKQEIADIKNIVSPSKNETPEAPLQEEGVDDWEKVFDRGFVWSLASDNCYALFRTMSDKEVEQNPAVSGTITIAKPEYVKAFIRQALATQKEQTVREILEEIYRHGKKYEWDNQVISELKNIIAFNHGISLDTQESDHA